MKSYYSKYINEVEEYYSKNYKKYHSIHHIQRLFDIYFRFRDKFLEEFPNLNEDDLFEAIAWHDSVYIIGGELNEEFSAQLYAKHMLDKGSVARGSVYNAILSTKIGTEVSIGDIEKVLHDLDWSYFSDYYHIFKKFSEQILFEATYDELYTVNTVKENQLKFYKSYLNKDIYVTKTFSEFNEIAKKNIKLIVEQLKKELNEMR